MALDGTYEITVKTPMGSQKGTLVFETDGTHLTGTSDGAAGISPLLNGKADGDAFEFMVEVASPVGGVRNLSVLP